MAYTVFTGGYTQPILLGTGEVIPGQCPGIASYRLEDNGELSLRTVSSSTPNPSYLAVNRRCDRLYCVNELSECEGVPTSTVTAYRICPETGALEYLNAQPTGGADACFLSLAWEEKFLLVGNYTGGSCAVFPIREDGSIDAASCFLQHSGSSVDPLRQTGPHVHHITPTPDGQGVLAVDLGQDKIIHYSVDWERGHLISGRYPDIDISPGHGPRHLVWGKDGTYLYVITEMTGQIYVFRAGQQGAMELVQCLCAAPQGTVETSGAAIKLHPNGQYLYVSLRSTNIIGVFRVKADGTLCCVQHVSSQGRVPRDITISPDGRFLVAANQESGNLVAFRLDPRIGSLTPTASVQALCATGVVIV